MITLAYLALLQNFVRIQALKMALIGATIIMLTEGSSMAATITVHARHETHRYDGRRPMIKLVVTALVAAIMVIALALAARAQTGTVPLPPIEFDRPYTGRLIIHTFDNTDDLILHCNSKPTTLACARHGDGWCFIYKVTNRMIEVRGYNPDHVMRHEHGHCNNWSGKHDNARIPSKEDDIRWKRLYDARVLYLDRRAPPTVNNNTDAVVRTLP